MIIKFSKVFLSKYLTFRCAIKPTYNLSTLPLFSEKLINKKIIKISGTESLSFLQGLVTADVELLANGDQESFSKSLYSMMLNAQGRILYDLFLYRIDTFFKEDSSILIECEASLVNEIITYLKKYKIRKKLTFSVLEELSVWVVMQDVKERSRKDFNTSFSNKNQVLFSHPDPRLSWLAHRLVLPQNINVSEVLEGTLETRGAYKQLRYLHGVAEGPTELTPSSLLPLDANLHFLNGVSFSKGCYIGQELTARTHYTGVIRKRIMSLFSKEDLDLDTSKDDLRVYSTSTNKECGRLKAWQGRTGLGLLRVQESLLNTGSLVLKKAPVSREETDGKKEDGEVLGEVTTRMSEWWPVDEDEIIKSTIAKMKSN